jgi:hypothetical protein
MNTNDLQTEPALTLGDIFANKALLKTYVAAAIGIISLVLNRTVADATVEDITQIVYLASLFVTPFVAQFENGQRAKEQAAVTREAVYSPATTEALVRDAAVTGDPVVPAPPADGVITPV